MSSPLPGPPLIDGAEDAARVLCDYFLANADRGENAANDELVTELVRRMRAGQTCGAGASSTSAEAALLRHRSQGIQ